MNKYPRAITTFLLFVKYMLIMQPFRLSNDRLTSLLRMQLHNIEKGLSEETSDFILFIWTRELYFEAKKRNLLSQEEKNWCKRILFGKQTETIDKKEDIHDLLKIIKNRRSIRFWKSEQLQREEFERLVDAARWAPSSCNRQPVSFLLTNDKTKIALLSEVRGQKFIENASSCILVFINMQFYNEKEAAYTPYLDAGAAIQNLLLMAYELGLGACWVNFGSLEVNEAKKEKLKAVFNIPYQYKIVSLVPIGHTDFLPPPPGRKNISDMLHYEVLKLGKDKSC